MSDVDMHSYPEGPHKIPHTAHTGPPRLPPGEHVRLRRLTTHDTANFFGIPDEGLIHLSFNFFWADIAPS
jgi:hypothetical protein